MLVSELTLWHDKVATLTLKRGESTTARILYVDPKQNELIADVLASNRSYPDSDQHAFVIPVGQVLSVSPAPAGMRSRHVPLAPDPCRTPSSFSLRRFALFAPILLTLIPGGVLLFMFLGHRPDGVQLASLVCYTAAVSLYTFGGNGYLGLQRYLFSCPFVRSQLFILALRHAGFLVFLFVMQTVSLRLRPLLSPWWLTASGKNASPFVTALFILCGCLALIQIATNRSLLKRVHLEYNRPDFADSLKTQS